LLFASGKPILRADGSVWMRAAEEVAAMERLKQGASDVFSRISSGFSHGLGQMIAVGREPATLSYDAKTPADALRGDWEKVGADLGRAIDTVRERAKAS
jgi:hypothetical protein